MSRESHLISEAIGREFALRALFIVGLIAGVIAISAVSVMVVDTLLILFGAILFSLALRCLGDEIARRANLSKFFGFLCGSVALVAIIVIGGVLIGPSVNSELQKAGPKFSATIEDLRQQAERQEWLADVNQRLQESDISAQQLLSAGFVPDAAGKMFATSFGLLTSLALVLIVGFWIAWNPGVYRNLAIKLVPVSKRQHANSILNETGEVLSHWILGRLLAMLTVGVLVTIALLILGVPLPFTLGIVAGLISFVPTIGAFLAIIPSLLFALPQGMQQVGLVLAAYLAIQLLENNLITPLVMKRAVSIPPAVVLLMQLAMGMLVGGLGVAFAVPLAAAASVLIRRLYVQDVLGDDRPTKLQVPNENANSTESDNYDSPGGSQLETIGSRS